MNKIHVASICLALSAMISQVAKADTDRTALSLAIQRFDENQAKPLNKLSPEFIWMQTFIKTAVSKSPDLGHLLMKKPVDLLSDPFRTSSIRTGGENTAESSLFTKYIKDWVTKATLGCTAQTSNKDNFAVSSYFLGSSNVLCKTDIAKGLLEIGINRVTFGIETDSRGAEIGDVLLLSAPEDSLQLMRGVISQLSKVPGSDMIARAFSESMAGVSRGGMIGESSFEIKMDRSKNQATFDDKIELNLKKGWGDCMAGCIHKHYWKIDGTPKKVGDHYEFDVEITESGSPVPDDADRF